MTVPFPIMIRAFVITRFWADSPQFPDRFQNQTSKITQTALFIFLSPSVISGTKLPLPVNCATG